MQTRTGLANMTPTTDDDPPPPQQTFLKEGDYWSVCYEGFTCRLRDSKGMLYLAYLLKHPDEEVASWELMRLASPNRPEPVSESPSVENIERARVAVTKNIKAALLRIREHHPALADHLDATVRRGYACAYRPDPRVPIRWS